MFASECSFGELVQAFEYALFDYKTANWGVYRISFESLLSYSNVRVGNAKDRSRCMRAMRALRDKHLCYRYNRDTDDWMIFR